MFVGKILCHNIYYEYTQQVALTAFFFFEIDKIISQNVASSNNNANAHEAAQFAL